MNTDPFRVADHDYDLAAFAGYLRDLELTEGENVVRGTVVVQAQNPGLNPQLLERAIASERVRLAMGLNLRPIQTRHLMTEGMDAAAIAEQYYEPPLINIIPYACHACPTNQYRVTESCQNCLAASCQKVCPKGAISFVNGKSHIDPDKCIKCGACKTNCSFDAVREEA